MEPPRPEGVVAAPSASVSSAPPQTQSAPRPAPASPGDNNSSCENDVPEEDSSQDVSPAARTDVPDVQYRTFSEVVRAAPVPAARQLGEGEVGALSSAAAEAQDEDDTGPVALCQHEGLIQGGVDNAVIHVEPPLAPRAPSPLRDDPDDAPRFGGYVAHGLEQDEQDLSILVLDEEGSSTSLESAVSELAEDVDEEGRDHFLSPLKRIVRIYLRRRTVAPETMGNLQGSEGKAGRSGGGGKSPGKLRKAAAAARKSPFRPGKGPAPAPPPTRPTREQDDEADDSVASSGAAQPGGSGAHRALHAHQSGTATAAAAASAVSTGPDAGSGAGEGAAGTDRTDVLSTSAGSGSGSAGTYSDPFLTPQSADAASHYSDADGAEGRVTQDDDDQDDDDDDDPLSDALSDARTLTPASARHSSRLQDKTSDDDATLTDCDDRSDWERTPQPTPVHAQHVKASLQDLCAVESVGLSRDDLTYSMAGSMTGSMAGSVSSVSGLSGSVGSVSGAVSSLGGGSVSVGGSRSSFTVTRHRKVDLAQARIAVCDDGADDLAAASRAAAAANAAAAAAAAEASRRHSSLSDAPIESNVLRKVASLTLDRATLDQKLSKPKFVPEKLDFQIYEKFEGQVLINWFLSSFPDDHYLRQVLMPQDLRILAAQFCTNLLKAGVVRQLQDKDPLDSLFRPDLIYYWTHAETVATAPPTPGRLSQAAWPPAMGMGMGIGPGGVGVSGIPVAQSSRPGAKYTEAENGVSKGRSTSVPVTPCGVDNSEEFQQTLMGLKREHRESLTSLAGKQELSLFTLRGEYAAKLTEYESKIAALEAQVVQYQQEIERNKTIASIQSLTNQAFADFKSPTLEEKQFVPLESNSISEEVLESVKDSNVEDEALTKDKASALQAVPFSPRVISTACTGTQTEDVSTSDFATSPIKNTNEDLQTELPLNNGAPPPPPMPEAPPPPPMPEAPPPPPMPGAPPPPPMPEAPPPPPMPGAPPPPPMPGAPPPPPMPGAPPPPPMPGAPPPPPMPGAPPPPPMPGAPPPPPMPGAPPPPPMPGAPPPPPMPGGGPPPPPPPPGAVPPPPPPGITGPKPFPAPPSGGWSAQKAMFRKEPLNPPVSMKPLYWTRIVVPVSVTINDVPEPASTSNGTPPPLWEQLEEAKIEDMDAFTSLFSRQVIERKPTKKKTEKPTKQQAVKILDSKRSQNIGILASSLHKDFSEIEHAIYNLDTTEVSLEALQQIYEVRASAEELQLIRAHVASNPDAPLDKPEQFLYELAEIPNFAERIACFMFQSEFEDRINSIESKLNNIKSTSEELMESKSLQTVLSIILALGNFMNGGNRTRGQADGFGLEILPKLRDVKSSDNSLTLLHFIVRAYMKKVPDPVTAPLPVPEPADIDKAGAVMFDDLTADLKKIEQQLKACESKSKKVIAASSEENLQPFKDKMETFLSSASKRVSGEMENQKECMERFVHLLKFYQYQPKGTSNLAEVAPRDFFPLWSPFCSDFKDIWKKEQQKIAKEKMNATKKRVEKMQNVEKMRKQETGLKARLQKKIATSTAPSLNPTPTQSPALSPNISPTHHPASSSSGEKPETQ